MGSRWPLRAVPGLPRPLCTALRAVPGLPRPLCTALRAVLGLPRPLCTALRAVPGLPEPLTVPCPAWACRRSGGGGSAPPTSSDTAPVPPLRTWGHRRAVHSDPDHLAHASPQDPTPVLEPGAPTPGRSSHARPADRFGTGTDGSRLGRGNAASLEITARRPLRRHEGADWDGVASFGPRRLRACGVPSEPEWRSRSSQDVSRDP